MRFLLAFTLLITAPAQTPNANAQATKRQAAQLRAPLKNAALKVAPPTVPTAVATIVLDLNSNRILEEKNAHQRMFPASTTKLMTCLVAMERGDLNQIIRASKNAEATDESGIDLLAGENHTLRELIEAALVHSANDACVAIAEGVGGTQANFVGWMNEKARELGCRDTHFVNPHGLHDPQHYTSAHDLAVIGRAVLQVPFLDSVVRQKTATIGGNWKIGPKRVMVNRNKLLFRWAQCDGLKTGYTRQAGNCLVASATQKNPATEKPWRLLAVAMKSVPGSSFGDCQWLLQRAFASYQPQLAQRGGQIVAKKAVSGGASELQATSKRDLWLPTNAFERQTLQRRVKLLPLTAPLKAGATVGNVEYWAAPNAQSAQSPRRLAQMTLVSRGAVSQTFLARALPPLAPVSDLAGEIPAAPRLWFLPLLCGSAALLLLYIRQSHARRRRSHPAFKSARLNSRSEPPDNARNGANSRH